MSRIDEIEEYLAEPPTAQDELLDAGRLYQAVDPDAPFPVDLGIAVQMASNLSRVGADLTVTVGALREVRRILAAEAAYATDASIHEKTPYRRGVLAGLEQAERIADGVLRRAGLTEPVLHQSPE
jgi:hypothetical protein